MCSLLAEKSYDDVTVIELCERAEVVRITFYNDFKDKDEFLGCCIKELLSSVFFETEAEQTKTSGRFSGAVRDILRFVKERRPIIENLFAAKNGAGICFVQKVVAEYFRDRAVEIDKVPVPPELYGEYCAASIVFIVRWCLEEGKDYSERQIENYVETLVGAERFE